jgi:glycine dehydrogenase subunit 1
LSGYSLPFTGPYFNEFVVRGPGRAVDLLSRLGKEKGIDGGIALSRFIPDRPNDFLVCVTETNSRAQIDALVEGLSTV